MTSALIRCRLRSMALVAGAVMAIPAAQAQAPAIDPQQLLLQILQRQAQAQGLAPAVPQQPARAAQPTLTEAQLDQQLQAWPQASGPFEIERFRDGFSINGQRVLDPEGQITQYAVDSATGDHAYLAQTLPGQYVLKLSRHKAGAAVPVAWASRQGGLWTVETATGSKLSGSRLILSPRGLIMARDNVFFQWTAGQGLQPFDAPETHVLAAHQNGDVAGTGWVLLEKRAEAKAQEAGALGGTALGGLLGSIKRLGATVGVNGSDTDFALYHLASRKLVPLGIAMEEKQAQFMSQCRQRNTWIAMCDRMDTLESVYGQDGRPNRGHYFWRVSWFRTATGPVAVVMENGITQIDAILLGTEQRAPVFQRSLGIGDWGVRQTADGRVRVQAKLGFEQAVNEDVAALLAQR